MSRWLRLIGKQLLEEIKHFKLDRAAIFSILVAIFAGVFTYRQVGKEKFMSDFFASTFPYLQGFGVALGVMMVFLLVRSVYSVYEHADTRAVIAEARVASLTQKPLLNIKIREAFIVPKSDRVAECFFRLSILNDTMVECSPSEFRVVLRIKGADYDHTSPLDLKDYRLCYGKIQTKYDNEGGAYEIWSEVSHEKLHDITDGGTVIVRGAPLEGWIGTATHNVPEWEHTIEVIGTYSESEYDDDGNAVGEYPTDVCEKVLHLTGVETLRVIILDSFNQEWISETGGPFESKTKRVWPREPEPEERDNRMFTRPKKG